MSNFKRHLLNIHTVKNVFKCDICNKVDHDDTIKTNQFAEQRFDGNDANTGNGFTAAPEVEIESATPVKDLSDCISSLYVLPIQKKLHGGP